MYIYIVGSHLLCLPLSTYWAVLYSVHAYKSILLVPILLCLSLSTCCTVLYSVHICILGSHPIAFVPIYLLCCIVQFTYLYCMFPSNSVCRFPPAHPAVLYCTVFIYIIGSHPLRLSLSTCCAVLYSVHIYIVCSHPILFVAFHLLSLLYCSVQCTYIL